MVFINETFIDFLIFYKESIVSEWNERIMISSHDPYMENIAENRERFFDLIIKSLSEPENLVDEYIKSYSHLVAGQRYKANIHIDEFIHNCSLGRSIIYYRLAELQKKPEELCNVLLRVNECFDKCIFYAVSHYSELKTQIIESQYNFLSQTHKDRLTLLGQMTSSFVHEFRNPLTSIMGFVQLLQSEHAEIKYLDIISKELEQLNYRITQFLNLSKKESLVYESKLFSVSELANEVIEFLYPAILEVNAAISVSIPDGLYIHGAKEEFRQVFINIILNALDVISNISLPSISITGEENPEGYLTLHIANNGPKIPDDIISTIFEPFTTTKKTGTGLGLFVCREIIEKHNGTLSCTSSASLTTFTIHTPCVKPGLDYEIHP
ncbi:histidine kinase N-terminal domain-containing protein [Bacillus sp. MUM 13]|uniref:sensor histidine kinase n=1 Tax=Bacillus sp. MUM 13 TaxID=1678001 RepID=UPI0008F5E5A8|nr:histidine kinase N-terminal domain-containing protein [Bacillus sp. MUM 13]OIK08671.1 hypothetical protein BIV59_19270 [Bacillus sp. MUM 13]